MTLKCMKGTMEPGLNTKKSCLALRHRQFVLRESWEVWIIQWHDHLVAAGLNQGESDDARTKPIKIVHMYTGCSESANRTTNAKLSPYPWKRSVCKGSIVCSPCKNGRKRGIFELCTSCNPIA
mmetsp:Transcript_4684/g.29534  ORF Transcript_4684/g.29534 Transcript_4684/m.29534 type:complete len:123 (+) Transcript_4684:1787-2155(+)